MIDFKAKIEAARQRVSTSRKQKIDSSATSKAKKATPVPTKFGIFDPASMGDNLFFPAWKPKTKKQ